MAEHDLMMAESSLNASRMELASSIGLLIMRLIPLMESLADPYSHNYRFMREKEAHELITRTYEIYTERMNTFMEDMKQCRAKDDAKYASYNLTPECIAKKH